MTEQVLICFRICLERGRNQSRQYISYAGSLSELMRYLFEQKGSKSKVRDYQVATPMLKMSIVVYLFHFSFIFL